MIKKIILILIMFGSWSAFMLASAQTSTQNDTIKLIVITAPGGAADQATRIVAEKLGPALNKNIIVENKPGAGGNIASKFVASAKPDGYTFLMTSNNHTINPFIYKDPGYSTLVDLLPVVQVARGPTVIAVHPQTPMNSMKELIAFSQTKPVSYGSIGVGSAAHLVGECLKPVTGAKFEHVPYKGGAPAVFDAVAGHIPLVMSSLASLGPYIKSGKLRALAVSSAERWPGYTEIPTLNELGMGECTYDIWLGIVAPKGTPASIINSMNSEISSLLKTKEMQEKILGMGYMPVGNTVKEFDDMVRSDINKTSKMIKGMQVQVE
jgi:tripartite-type tricarboxylate transporter receptor subunit TctC